MPATMTELYHKPLCAISSTNSQHLVKSSKQTIVNVLSMCHTTFPNLGIFCRYDCISSTRSLSGSVCFSFTVNHYIVSASWAYILILFRQYCVHSNGDAEEIIPRTPFLYLLATIQGDMSTKHYCFIVGPHHCSPMSA